MKKRNVDLGVVIPSLVLIGAVVTALLCFPTASRTVIDQVFDYLLTHWSWAYSLCVIVPIILLLWVTFSKYGNIRFGKPEDKPEYSMFAWAGMLFTSNVGSSIVTLGFLEPLYYVQTPPFDIEAYSGEAYEYAHMYGQFHWGPSAWAIYIPAIIAVGVVVYRHNAQTLRLSSVTEHVGNKKLMKPFGKVIDILVVFGIIAGISTSMGLGVPVVSNVLSSLLNIPDTMVLRGIVVLIWIGIFVFSTFRGLTRGIQLLSNINIAILGVFLLMLFFINNPQQIISAEINSIGLYTQNFIRLNTWLDPFGSGEFLSLWTIFYWGWWLSFMPLIVLFIVRTSRGRTLKQVLWGQLLLGSAGTSVCFMVLGSVSLQLQQSGQLDIISILNQQGQAAAVLAILNQLPLSNIFSVMFVVLLFIFLATCIDSAAYILASNCEKSIKITAEPSRTHRICWAVVLGVVSIALVMFDMMKAVQTLSIASGFFLIFVQFYMIYAAIKLLKREHNQL